jgi:ribosomal protein L39E
VKPDDVNKQWQMKANKTEQKFLKLAKTVQSDERVPGGFAARVMAQVQEQHALETGSADEQFLRIARNLPDNERVPYAFEKRIMARLRELLTPDPLTHWSRMLWRAAAPCLGVMMLAMLFSAGEPAETSANLPVDQSEATDFESVMLASFDDLELTW